jgi:hypothetical protein
LRQYLELLEDPQELYRLANDGARRLLNNAFYTKIYCNDHGRVTDEKQPAIDELLDLPRLLRIEPRKNTDRYQRSTALRSHAKRGPSTDTEASTTVGTRIDLLGVTGVSFVTDSSKAVLVGRVGLEPTTQGL